MDDHSQMITMTESRKLAQLSTYMVDNRIKVALEAESQQNMVMEAIVVEINKDDKSRSDLVPKSQRLKCIYNDELLEFEKDPLASIRRIHTQDPLEKVDLGNGTTKRPTFISTNMEPSLKSQIIEFL